jgi:hypothetical protein
MAGFRANPIGTLRKMSDPDLEWPETTGTVARKAGCEAQLVREYADARLIPSRRLPNGTRLFRADADAQVRKLKAERLARRGRYSRQSTREARA